MTRKTSTYSRKRSTTGHTYKRNAWLAAVQRCQSFDTPPVAGEEPSANTADHIMVKAHTHLDMLMRGQLSTGDTETHDYLAHCIGIAQIRTLDIGGPLANDVMQDLNDAAMALRRTRDRWERMGKWGLDGPGLQALPVALDHYETILRASSPQQMENAQTIRLEQLKAKT